MKLMCRAVNMTLASLDADTELVEPLASHLESCLRCQAEAARYRSLQRSLVGLSNQIETAPAGFAADVETQITKSGGTVSLRTPVRFGRLVGAAGAVAAAAAGTVAMVRWMRTRSAA